MEVADRIVVMNEGRIEQIGSPAEIYDQPATPFVMSFVGAVNVVPRSALLAKDSGQVNSTLNRQSEPEPEPVFIRPHDVQVFTTPQQDSVPAKLRRLRHMGRDLQAELVLADGEVLMAQFPREQIDYQAIKPGDGLHIVSRQVRSFEPDYMI